jgi:hypothetical protein
MYMGSGFLEKSSWKLPSARAEDAGAFRRSAELMERSKSLAVFGEREETFRFRPLETLFPFMFPRPTICGRNAPAEALTL